MSEHFCAVCFSSPDNVSRDTAVFFLQLWKEKLQFKAGHVGTDSIVLLKLAS